MENNETLFETESAFSKYNKYIAALLAVYYLMIVLFGKNNSIFEVVIGVGVSAALLLDWAAGMKKYFHKKFVLRIIRYSVMFMSAFAMLYTSGIYVTIFIMSAVYMATVFEHLFLYDISEDYYKISAVLETIFPMTLVTLIYYFFASCTNFEIIIVVIFIVIFVMILVSNMKVCGELIDNLLNNMYRQERIATNSKEEYENLKVYQSKLVHANEQLSIQRFQLQKLNESVKSQNRQMDLQHKILRRISASLEIGKLTEFVTSSITTNLQVEVCGIFMFDIVIGDDEPKDFFNLNNIYDIKLPDNTVKLFKEFVSTEEFSQMCDGYMVVNDVNEEIYPFVREMHISSFLIYVVNLSENQKGYLFVGKKTNGYFNDNNIGFYKGIGEQMTVAINNAELYAKMHDMATKDSLTKIFNRRHFNAKYPELIRKAKEENKVLTVILFDIDKFKNINDKYGHLFGDGVISYCGYMAGKTANENNAIAVRYGGEEFVIVFPDKNVEEVYAIVEKMHGEIKEKVLDYEGTDVHVDVSIGIASYPETCADINEILSHADIAMYYSKNTGRGRITIDSGKSRGEE